MSAPFVHEVNNGYAVGQDPQSLPPNYSNIDSDGGPGWPFFSIVPGSSSAFCSA